MSKWQYDLMFCFVLAGAVFLMVAKPVFNLQIDAIALTGYGTMTTYVLTQRAQWTKTKEAESPPSPTDK